MQKQTTNFANLDSEELWNIISPVVEKIVKRCANKHSFYYFEKNDIAQEIRMMCFEAARQYDSGKGKLENFLARSVSNRTINLKRNNHHVSTIPCIACRCEFYNKKQKTCELNYSICLDWKNYEKLSHSKVAINYPSEYTGTTKSNDSVSNSLLGSTLDEYIEYCEIHDVELYNALVNFRDNNIPVSDKLLPRFRDLIQKP